MSKRYIEDNQAIADITDSKIDPISFEPLELLNNSRFGTIAIQASGRIIYFNTEQLWSWVMSSNTRPTNPLTRQQFTPDELRYIEHYSIGYNMEKEGRLNIDENSLYTELIRSSDFTRHLHYNLARYILTPYSFSKQFKEYQRNTENINDINVERTGANVDLHDKPDGTWLIRYSSYNTTYAYEHIKRQGIRFFVISIVRDDSDQKVISHHLLIHQPGRGWAKIRARDISITQESITYNTSIAYYVCFLDLLTDFMTAHDLSGNRYIRTD